MENIREELTKAIRETLVVENKQSIKYAVDKIIKLTERYSSQNARDGKTQEKSEEIK